MAYIQVDKITMSGNSVYYDNKQLVIETPVMRIPFEIKKEFNKFKLRLEFSNLEKDDNIQHFLSKLIDIEDYFQKYIGCDNFKSPIVQYNNFDPFIEVTLPYRYNKFEVDIKSDINEIYLPIISDVKKNMYVKCKLVIPKLWDYTKDNSRNTGYIIQAKEITIIKNCV